VAEANSQHVTQQRRAKAQIEAFTASREEVVYAIARDTNEFGIYSNGSWERILIATESMSGRYRMFV